MEQHPKITSRKLDSIDEELNGKYPHKSSQLKTREESEGVKLLRLRQRNEY
jgi:hypothetical protein